MSVLERARERIRKQTRLVPEVALILGSGLGDLAKTVEQPVSIPANQIEGYPASTVAGHPGRIVLGALEDVPVLFFQGRAHLYEGHSVQDVAYPVRLASTLGARRLLVTNAAGGIRPGLRSGTLMFISDHLNWVGLNPVAGGGTTAPDEPPAAPGFLQAEGRPGLAQPAYDPSWLDEAERTAIELGIRAARGVYLWTRGPSYETKAEIAAFRRLGADAVGMSTVPEVVQAAALRMKVLGISAITNPAAGLSGQTLSHEDVLRVGMNVRSDLERLVRRLLRALA